MQAEGENLVSVMHKQNRHFSGSSLLLYQLTKRVIKLTVITIVDCHCYQKNRIFRIHRRENLKSYSAHQFRWVVSFSRSK
jgi:hypothetical protein